MKNKLTDNDMEELKKDRECLHCENFFDCAGKPKEVDQCLMFVERKDKHVTV